MTAIFNKLFGKLEKWRDEAKKLLKKEGVSFYPKLF
jgi:hypothetical protein